jgi:hypothetical protein
MLARTSAIATNCLSPLTKHQPSSNTVFRLRHFQPNKVPGRRTMATASHIELSPSAAGVYHVPDITAESGKVGSQLLQENHEKYHIFFNQSGFHNHIAHHLLTIYALGATPDELQAAFDKDKSGQRSRGSVKEQNVESMADPETFKKFLGKEQYFRDFEEFFTKEVEEKGWEKVLNEHLFARTEHADRILVRMFGGKLQWSFTRKHIFTDINQGSYILLSISASASSSSSLPSSWKH